MEADVERIVDAVHGEITLRGRVFHAYRHEAVQRLRHLQQLGGASVINSNLNHNRLSHSVGVSHLARLWALHLKEASPEAFAAATRRHGMGSEEELVDVFALAGLLHDLGHAPFSHTFELFARMAGAAYEHERVSLALVDLVLAGPEFRLGRAAIDLAKRMICPKRDEFLHCCPNPHPSVRALEDVDWSLQIISGDVDVDRMDYLNRDMAAWTGERPLSAAAADHLRSHALVVEGRLAWPHACADCALHAHAVGRARVDAYLAIYNEPRVKGVEVMLGRAMAAADGALGLTRRAAAAAADPAAAFEQFRTLVDGDVERVGLLSEAELAAHPPAAAAGLRRARALLRRIARRDFYPCTSTVEVEVQPKADAARALIAAAASARLEGAGLPPLDPARIHVHQMGVGYGHKARSPLAARAYYALELEPGTAKPRPRLVRGAPPAILRVLEPRAYESKTMRLFLVDDEGPRATWEEAAAADAALAECAKQHWRLVGVLPAPAGLGPPPATQEEGEREEEEEPPATQPLAGWPEEEDSQLSQRPDSPEKPAVAAAAAPVEPPKPAARPASAGPAAAGGRHPKEPRIDDFFQPRRALPAGLAAAKRKEGGAAAEKPAKAPRAGGRAH